VENVIFIQQISHYRIKNQMNVQNGCYLLSVFHVSFVQTFSDSVTEFQFSSMTTREVYWKICSEVNITETKYNYFGHCASSYNFQTRRFVNWMFCHQVTRELVWIPEQLMTMNNVQNSYHVYDKTPSSKHTELWSLCSPAVT
jgi:hypothetical protein